MTYAEFKRRVGAKYPDHPTKYTRSNTGGFLAHVTHPSGHGEITCQSNEYSEVIHCIWEGRIVGTLSE